MNKPEDKGVYRRVPVRIMWVEYTEPVQPYMIEPKISEFLAQNEKRKGTMNIFERIARFHLEFESMYPFIDGNGRAERLLMNFELMQYGYPPINVKFADRKRYYVAFDSYSKNQDAKPMINLITEYVSERLGQYLMIIGM